MKLLKRTLIFLCLLSLVLFTLSSCGENESLRLSADKTAAKHGEVVTFSTVHVTKKGEALTDSVAYEIAAGSESATLEGNKLTIAPTAKNGAVITVVAKTDELVSNAVNVTVQIPENNISISANKTVAQRGDKVVITVALTENGQAIDSANATLTITEGAEAVTLVGRELTIKDDAVNGTEIELAATYKELTSNMVKITVSVPVTGITASASKFSIPAGSFVTLQKVLNPTGAVGEVSWVITEGASLCTVSGDILAVNANATDGATIKVKAKCGNIESNELTFTVGDENASYLLLLSQNSLTVDRNGASATMLDVEILDSNLNPVTDRNVSFDIISGAEFLSITPNGNVCSFTALGHGDASIRVSLPGTNVSKTASVKVIVPPEAVRLPEMFLERLNLTYNVSKVDPRTNLPDRLPFVANARGSNVCTDLKYTFEHEDGTVGSEVAEWADGSITFKKNGRVTLTVSSDSGSRNEVTATYTFQVNSGYNVNNYTELKTLIESDSYNGEIVNIVVTEKLTGQDGHQYGYDLVPPEALKLSADQTWQSVFWHSMIWAKNKNVYINGNNHKIDGSQLRVITQTEINDLANQGYTFANIESLLMITPDAQDPAQLAGRQHFVKIFDLEVVGNTPIDFEGDLNGIRPLGSYNTGICIGDVNYDVVYHIEMENVTASRCNVGLRYRHAISDSTVDDINVYNCFSNGIEVEASIITFGDMEFGKCGAAGLEMVPSNSTRAGDALDQKQKITFAGKIDTTQNLSKGDSKYLSNYGAAGYTVPQILQGVLQQYPNNKSHMMNSNGEFGFVTFIFHDISTGTVNQSEAVYPAYQAGGIINAKSLPIDGSVDTTHEYILLEIDLGQGINLGYALLYNHHYGAN